MEKKLKTIMDIEPTVLSRQGEGSALNESERVMSASEMVFLRELKKRGLEMLQKNKLDVWIVGNKRNDLGSQFKALQAAHNEEVRLQKNDKNREYRFQQQDFGDFRYNLQEKFGKLDLIMEVPEMIVVQSEASEGHGTWTGLSKMIHEAVDKSVNNLYRYWDEKIALHLGEQLYSPLANKVEVNKAELSEEAIMEYGLTSLELMQEQRQQVFFEKYILTQDEKYVAEFFSDDVLREIYEYACNFDEEKARDLAQDFLGQISEEGAMPGQESEFFAQFKVPIDHKKKRAEWEAQQESRKQKGEAVNEFDDYDWEGEEVSPAIENYVSYRKSIAEFSQSLPFENIKEKMRSSYIAIIKKELDSYSTEYIRQYDMFEAEKKLLKPILVYVSENPVQRELMRDSGAEVVLENISSPEIQGLLELLGKMKSSAASLMPEKLRRIKAEFYKSVEDKLEARSEITAETVKELELLQEIFAQAGDIKNVLDVACGNGRISIPLSEKGYAVTGVDANENLLQSALKKGLEKNFSGTHFKIGDVIDYRGVVESGSQDAVIYTWHSILEAFGPGNLLQTLGSSWSVLRPGGVLVFDQPTRENPQMNDGWYGNDPDGEHHYLSYIMNEDEIKFILKVAGFEKVEIKKWKTKSSEEYPEGMHKFTVSAHKPK